MKKSRKVFVFFLFLLFVFSVVYTYFFREIVDDELYNYGFAKSILDGRVPYVDFNMIVPPFFPYLLSLFLKVFGRHILVYHCLLAFFIVGCVYFSYFKIGFKSIGLYFLLLIYPFTGYNTICLFFLMFLLYLDDKLGDKKDIVEAIIICMMFLSKQTLGLLIIPSLIFSRHKKKTLCVYFISFFLLLLYLIFEHSIYQFIDYCFLGMFEFGAKNGNFTWFFPIEILVVLILFVLSFRYKKKELCYVLCFQIVAFPSFDYVHFIVSFIPVMYLMFIYFDKKFFVNFFLISFSVIYFLIFSFGSIFTNNKYLHIGHYEVNNFMRGRLVQSATYYYIDNIREVLESYSNHKSYILGNFSYLVKLNLNLPIDKYDIINKGNMGYNGSLGYIKEIDRDCRDEKCVFIISDEEARGGIYNQVDHRILHYVQQNYYKTYSSNIFSVYIS